MRADCPCGSGRAYSACCRSFHLRTAVPETAEELMRSRYTAYAKRLESYLRYSWHPDTCPSDLTLDPRLVWTGLTIVETSGGGPDDDTGTVEFVATFNERGRLAERSEFVRLDGRWVYLAEE
ncbi:MAG: YchJ family metal-binding protein [Acidimicrobiales bacterium]